jgi:MFS family permease
MPDSDRSVDVIAPTDPRGGYRDLPKLAGVVFMPLGFLARFPLAMFTVGVTMLIAWARDSYGEAGIASGALGLGSAIGAPLVGALADRYGQRLIMQLVGVFNGLVMVVLVGLVQIDSPLGWILLVSFLIGFSAPQVGPLARARWIALVQAKRKDLGGERTLSAAMSWESMADEMAFVFGPVAVGAAVLLLGEYWPLIIAAIMTFVFVSGFAHHHTVESVKPGATARGVRTPMMALFTPRVSVPVFGMLTIGMVFGAMLTAVTAFAGERGNVADAAFLYGAMGVGSAITALATAMLPRGFWLPWRWVAGAALMLLGSLFLPMVHSVSTLLPILFLIGLGIGPSLVSIFAVASYTAPRDRVTVVLTLMSSGIVAGTAISAPIAGALADSAGYSQAFWVVTGAATLTLVSGLWTSKILPRPF